MELHLSGRDKLPWHSYHLQRSERSGRTSTLWAWKHIVSSGKWYQLLCDALKFGNAMLPVNTVLISRGVTAGKGGKTTWQHSEINLGERHFYRKWVSNALQLLENEHLLAGDRHAVQTPTFRFFWSRGLYLFIHSFSATGQVSICTCWPHTESISPSSLSQEAAPSHFSTQ